MRFTPPFCPNETCPEHHRPRPRFWVRHGYYQPKCRRKPIGRLRCRTCRRTFSRQTFRHDYRDHKPGCNASLFKRLIGGTGLRQSARLAGLGVSSVQRKFHKLARTCRSLHRNLAAALPSGRTFVLDEEETFEKASIRPLTMPVLIERETYFVVATMAGPIRRLAPANTARRWLQERDEAHRGPRRDRSRVCVRALMRTLRARAGTGPVCLVSDKKASYRALGKEVFGESLDHIQISGSAARGTFNTLFPINLTLAMTRDNCGRLHRQSWLVTEKRRCLQFQMHLFTAYRNYVRYRHNSDALNDTPAVLLGLLSRRLRTWEVLGWRQDWGARSIHPTSQIGTRAVG